MAQPVSPFEVRLIKAPNEKDEVAPLLANDSAPVGSVDSRRRRFGFRMRVPLANVGHGLPGPPPCLFGEPLMPKWCAPESHWIEPILGLRLGRIHDVNVLSAITAQKNAAHLMLKSRLSRGVFDEVQRSALNENPPLNHGPAALSYTQDKAGPVPNCGPWAVGCFRG